MNLKKTILLIVSLVLIAATSGGLHWLKNHQRLGKPGIKAAPTVHPVVMQIDLPEAVLDYTSTRLTQSETVTNFLPKDTSYAQRLYTAPSGFQVQANIILMGTDRISIHKPEYCLPGQGWTIREQTFQSIPIEGPAPYDLPVAKWTIRNNVKQPNGSEVEISGIYVFWFVADGEITPKNHERQWWLTRHLLRTGELQRWAYVSYFTQCYPGQEEATFEQVKQLIAASVPLFQHPPKHAPTSVAKQ